MLALVIGALLGLVTMLQVESWSALVRLHASGCGFQGGVSHGPCPRGVGLAQGLSIPVGLVTLVAAFILVLVVWVRRSVLGIGAVGMAAGAAVFIVGAAGGLLAGQALFRSWHGTDLAIAWAAPPDSSSDLTTVGSWVSGKSVVRVRVDQVVSYDGATGRRRWTLPVPGTDVACAASGDTGSDGAGTIGLVLYGPDSTSCDHVMAVDLATGHQVWTVPHLSDGSGSSSGVLGVADGTAVVLTGNEITGLAARTGAKRWTLTSRCDAEQLAASGGSVVALTSCGSGYDVASISPATGKTAWQYHVTEPPGDYQFQILSASPVVVADDLTGPRGSSEVRVFGPGGAVTARFPVSGLPEPGSGGQLTLDIAPADGFGVPEVIAGGALTGIAQDSHGHFALVSFALSGGRRRWVVPLPDQVDDITAGGSAQRGQVVLVDESEPAYSLDEISLATGQLRSFGFFQGTALEPGDSGLYTVGNDYVVVNLDGSGLSPPVTAIKAPAARHKLPAGSIATKSIPKPAQTGDPAQSQDRAAGRAVSGPTG